MAAAYVFAGSQPSLMHALFAEHERPFYGQARPLELPALPIAEAAHDIEALLVADGLNPGGAVDELLAYTGGHPQRTILLAHHLYNLLEQQPDHSDPAPAALELGLAETRDAHQALWDGLNRNERLVLLAVGDGQAPTGSVVASEHRVARSTLQEALERLLADERTSNAMRTASRTCPTPCWPSGSSAVESLSCRGRGKPVALGDLSVVAEVQPRRGELLQPRRCPAPASGVFPGLSPRDACGRFAAAVRRRISGGVEGPRVRQAAHCRRARGAGNRDAGR